jgi:hypothetical protein
MAQNSGYDRIPLAANGWGTIHQCCLSRVCLDGHTIGGPNTIPLYTREVWWGVIKLSNRWSYSVCGTTYISYALVHNQMLVHSDPADADLNRHRRELPPWSSEFTIQTTLNLHIQYSLFSPNCPARSPIMPTLSINSLGPHRTSKVGGPITSGYQPLGFYR